MSTRRVLTSRYPENDSRLSRLYEILFLLREALGLADDSQTDDEELLLDTIGENLVDLVIAHEDVQNRIVALSADVLNLTIANSMLEIAVEDRQRALETLASSPDGHADETDEAVKFFLGTPGVKMSMDPHMPTLQYTMDSDVLREAVKGAIQMYNLEHLSKMRL